MDGGLRTRVEAREPSRSRSGDEGPAYRTRARPVAVGSMMIRPRPALLAVAVGEAIDVFDGKGGRARPSRKDRNPTLETNVRIRDAPKEGFDERINGLAGLASEHAQSLLQHGVHGDGSVGHTSVIVS